LKKNRKIFLIVLVAAAITVIVKVVFYPAFNSENWKKYPDDRSKYVNSLMNSGILEGKEYEEVISLLGKPDIIRNNSAVGTDEHLYNPNNSILEYTTGGRGNFIDFERVQVHIQNNKAVKVNEYYD
jgi:hypothetical protein